VTVTEVSVVDVAGIVIVGGVVSSVRTWPIEVLKATTDELPLNGAKLLLPADTKFSVEPPVAYDQSSSATQ
jgi:hypothetical protein